MASFSDTVIEIDRGESAFLDFVVRQSDAAGAAAQDVTGWLFWMTGKRSLGDSDADALFQKEIGSGITITTPSTGVGHGELLRADTLSLPNRPTRVYVDLWGQDTLGKPHRVAKWVLLVQPIATEALV